MSQAIWSAVDTFFNEHLIVDDHALTDALQDSDQAGLPQINVTPTQGKLLNLLIQIQGAKKILEIGTLGGYSAIWMAQALPEDGRLITLEVMPENATVAKANIKRAGLSHKIDIRLGFASDTLPEIEQEGIAPFDFIFIDADKPSNPLYLEWALKLARIGTVIVLDNVVREGEVADAESLDANVIGVRQALAWIAGNSRLSATAVQTVGSKGYDGFLIATVVA